MDSPLPTVSTRATSKRTMMTAVGAALMVSGAAVIGVTVNSQSGIPAAAPAQPALSAALAMAKQDSYGGDDYKNNYKAVKVPMYHTKYTSDYKPKSYATIQYKTTGYNTHYKQVPYTVTSTAYKSHVSYQDHTVSHPYTTYHSVADHHTVSTPYTTYHPVTTAHTVSHPYTTYHAVTVPHTVAHTYTSYHPVYSKHIVSHPYTTYHPVYSKHVVS